jgi:hypothetical protein
LKVKVSNLQGCFEVADPNKTGRRNIIASQPSRSDPAATLKVAKQNFDLRKARKSKLNSRTLKVADINLQGLLKTSSELFSPSAFSRTSQPSRSDSTPYNGCTKTKPCTTSALIFAN